MYGTGSPGPDGSRTATPTSTVISAAPGSGPVACTSSRTAPWVSGSRVACSPMTTGAVGAPSTSRLEPPRQAFAKSRVTEGRAPAVSTAQRRPGSRSWSPRWFQGVSETTLPSSYQRSPCPVLKEQAKGSPVTVDRSATAVAGARQRAPGAGRAGSRDSPVQNRSSARWKAPGERSVRWLRVHSGR